MKQLLIILFFIPALCFAQVPDPMPNTYINDLANILTADQVKSINEKIYAIEKKSSVQIAVILMNDLPANMDIADYTLQVGRKWHVGNAHNGLVYAVAINQRKQRLEVAGALQGDIPDVTALHIIDKLKPFLRQKDYFGGMNILLDEIDQRIDPIKKEQMKLAAEELEKKHDEESDSALIIIMFSALGIGLIVAVVLIRRSSKKDVDTSPLGLTGTKYMPTMMAGTLGMASLAAAKKKREERNDDVYIPPPVHNYSNDNYTPPASNNDNNSNYGDWGSGSSSSSNDSGSGFDGGGAGGDF